MVELTPGLELGARFVLMRRLGRGGSAEVWLADDRERDERVALKFFDESFAGDPARMAQLADEVARARSLSREHTVGVYDVVEADGCAFLVMEYCAGGDLGQFRGRSFESWAHAADDVIAALEALHAKDLVHRDLKCANVMLDAAGRARLADFGLTAIAGTAAGGGSPYNASPQQLRGEPAQPADDLYAFGALLFELIAGHPPYYPEITRDRVLHEPVPPLVPRGVVPAGVRELALRLLAKSPEDRPQSAMHARAKLAAAAGDEAAVLAPLVHDAPVAAASRRGLRLLPIAIAGAAVIALLVVFMMPARTPVEDPEFTREAKRAAEQQGQVRRTQEEERAARHNARVKAEAARDAFDAALASLDRHAAARWATTEFAAARDAGAAAALAYSAEHYDRAASGWESASAQLAAIEKQRADRLRDAVAGGQRALSEGRTAAARKAFELALAIEANHPPAVAGLKRAALLDQVFPVIDAAAVHERAGRLTEAEAGFRRALGIDPGSTDAQAGISRIEARRAAEAYAAAMSRGFADLAAGRSASAREYFGRALELRPGSAEAREALASLDQGQRAAALRLLESRARESEAAERWDDALAAWREAAGLEASLQAAKDGIARVTPRAELQRRIEALNREPQRLWDPAGRAEARNLLASAAAAGNPRQRLAAAAQELGRLAAAAQTPVKLRLQSDGVTQVVIYRVGQYGTFSERDVELLPGKYTVVGTRNGFRDVRREVVLPPGAPTSAVVVRCEEPI